MYSRFLFVGLGGSGGKTLRFLKRDLESWLRQHNIEGPLPDGWQFINIDTPTVADGTEINDRVKPLPPDEYVGLISKAIDFKAVANGLDLSPNFDELMATWRVNPQEVKVPLTVGAGQERAIGQMVAMRYASTIQKALKSCLTKLDGAEVLPQMGKLYNQITGEQPGQTSNVYVVVVSSLAGGSGAGLLNLTCDILRADSNVGDNIFAVLYTPDVFGSLGGSATGGVQPNALAATSELMNGIWRKNAPDPDFNPVLIAAGVAKKIAGSGPSFPFLVGLKNTSGINFGTHDTAFEMTGRSLVSWVTASQAKASFVSYTIANWHVQAKNNTLGPVLVDEGGADAGFPQFSAMGFARVSVGANYFENYVAQRLARDANEHCADYHSASDEAKRIAKTLNETDPNILSQKIAEEQRDTFLRRVGLSEYGPDENQISDALTPDKSLLSDFTEHAKELAGIGAGGKQSVDQWSADIRSAVTAAQRDYSKKCEQAISELAEQWAENLQGHLLDEVEQQIANRGLHVTKSLCELAAAHLQNEVTPDLRDDAAKRRKWHSGWEREYQARLNNLAGNIDSDHPELDEAIRDAVYYAAFICDELVHEHAAELCPEISQKLLRPLVAALSDAHATAVSDKHDVVSWPVWSDGAPPKMVVPPAGEFTLVDVGDYPQHFNELFNETYAGEPLEQQRSKVRNAVIDGNFLKSQPGISDVEYRDARCLKVHHDWWPHAKWIDPSRSAHPLRVEAQASIDDLRRRAGRWLQREGTPFAKFGAMTLRSYLGSEALFAEQMSQQELEARKARFLTQLSAAIKASAPLIDIDDALLGIIHPRAVGESHQRFFREIPLQGHVCEKELTQLLVAEGVPDSKVGDHLGNDGSLQHVDITSILHAPHSLLVMKSLLEPIAGAWNENASRTAARFAFWRHRRGQPLDKFVPLPQSMLLCMIRGWFTGVLLGHIDPGDGFRPVQIVRSGMIDPVKFPYPFLTEGSDETIRLGQVLESLALANMSIGLGGNLDPLEPYKALRDLGKSDPKDLSSYQQPAAVLNEWIRSGDTEGSILDLHPEIQKINNSAKLDEGPHLEHYRAKSLAALFDKVLKSYERTLNEERPSWAQHKSRITKAPLWVGLWQPMERALEQLSDACSTAAQRLDSDTDEIFL